MTNLNGSSLIYFPQFLYCETMTKTSEKGQTYALIKEERLKRGLVRNDEVCRVKEKIIKRGGGGLKSTDANLLNKFHVQKLNSTKNGNLCELG